MLREWSVGQETDPTTGRHPPWWVSGKFTSSTGSIKPPPLLPILAPLPFSEPKQGPVKEPASDCLMGPNPEGSKDHIRNSAKG